MSSKVYLVQVKTPSGWSTSGSAFYARQAKILQARLERLTPNAQTRVVRG